MGIRGRIETVGRRLLFRREDSFPLMGIRGRIETVDDNVGDMAHVEWL